MNNNICPRCGTNNPANSNFCVNCGLQFNNNPKPPKKNNDGWIVASFMIAAAIVMIMLLIVGEANKSNPDDTTKEIISTETTTEVTTESSYDLFVSALSEYISDDEADKLIDILTNQLGYSKDELIFDCKYDGDNIYSIYLDNLHYKLMVFDGDYRIWNDSHILYEEGQVLMTKKDVEDRLFDSYDAAIYYDMAKEIIKDCLKSPSSAKFPSLTFTNDVAMARNKDLVVVKSYVTAENSFSAKIQTDYMVEFQVLDKDNFAYNVIYIQIDNETSGEYVDINTY